MTTARHGRGKTPWSSGPATVGMISRRICTPAEHDVTLVQRSPTLIVNIEPSAQLPYALYDEGPAGGLRPHHDIHAVLAHEEEPRHLYRTSEKSGPGASRQAGRVGFELDFGEDGTGWQFKYLTRGGGYYFNVGCSDLIVEGKIRLVQFSDIAEFVGGRGAAAARRYDQSRPDRAGDRLQGPGIPGAQAVRRSVADRVGPIWGFGDGDELRNMFTRTPQPGLWFIAGSFAQCRIYSKYLALQIKAMRRRAAVVAWQHLGELVASGSFGQPGMDLFGQERPATRVRCSPRARSNSIYPMWPASW